MDIRFVTKNNFKVVEAKKLLPNINIIHSPIDIHEIQSENVYEIIDDKLIKAFSMIGRPVFIEHTSLYIDCLNGFPGGLTQIFWDKLQADIFSEFIVKFGNSSVKAKTVIGYCDGKLIHKFEGQIKGNISEEPKGNRDFQWDCIFIPEGYDETFAEMGDKKNEISMRRMAFDKFNDFLRKG
jgi:XTP/dITP diphosphohydrolase